MPKGVNIPPKFADMFCKIKRYGMYFSCFATLTVKYPSGKKVISAISFAIIIEPIKVMIISIKNNPRRLPVNKTSFRSIIVKNLMFLNAQITAKVRNKQANVVQSK